VIYRVYCLDGAGRIGLAEWIDADNDSEAVAQAQTLKNGAIKCEIWESRRLVAVFGADAPCRTFGESAGPNQEAQRAPH
jgi:hypothetical protein